MGNQWDGDIERTRRGRRDGIRRLIFPVLWLAITLSIIIGVLGRIRYGSLSNGPAQIPLISGRLALPHAGPIQVGNAHPRLFFGAADIEKLRAEADTTHAEIWKPIKDFAAAQIDSSPPLKPQSNGDLDYFRNAGNELIDFAFVCVITGDNAFCDLATKNLLAYSSWPQWSEQNLRDLGLAHMLLGSAIAYDWLFDRMSAKEQQTIRQNLGNWAQKMYEASASQAYQASWGNWWGQAYAQNHNWVNNSALGMAGLALLGEDDRAQTWIDQAKDDLTRVQYVLNGIRDGSWHEGIQYQNYGLTLMLPFLVNLRRIEGVDILPHGYLRSYPTWRIYNSIPNSSQFILAYGDFEWFWGNSYMAQNILRFIAGEYRDPAAEWMAEELIAADGRSASIYSVPWYVFEFLYFQPETSPALPEHLPNSWLFSDLEGVIWRTGWEAQDLIFALKSGAFGGNFIFNTFTQSAYPWEPPCADTGCQLNSGHDHDDVNGFYLYKNGRWLAPERVGYGMSDSNYHNTILIDQRSQYRPAESNNGKFPSDFSGSNGTILTTADTPRFDYLSADATRSYKNVPGVQLVNRQTVFVRPGYLVMFDNLAASDPHRYQWVSHFGESIALDGDWVRGSAGGGQILGVGIVSPHPYLMSTGNDGYPYIHIEPASPVNKMHFINVLYPTDNAGWNSRPDLSLLVESEQASGLKVQHNDGSGLVDSVMVTYDQGGKTVQVGQYSFDGQVSAVTRDAENNLVSVFMSGGTSLTDGASGVTLVQGLDRGQTYEAAYAYGAVALNGNVAARLTIYAPDADTVRVNGAPWDYFRTGDMITLLGPLRCNPKACG